MDAPSTLEAVAEAYWGERGKWIYRAFRAVNADYFGGRLPVPLIQWALTPHGSCLGRTQTEVLNGRPIVTLHPAIWGSGKLRTRELSSAWNGVPACRLYTLDVLIHELVHVHINAVGGEGYAEARKGRRITSHDNVWWPGEVERISPLLGLGEVVASQTKRARREGRMMRVPAKEGAIAMTQLASWPCSLRSKSYYARTGQIPWE